MPEVFTTRRMKVTGRWDIFRGDDPARCKEVTAPRGTVMGILFPLGGISLRAEASLPVLAGPVPPEFISTSWGLIALGIGLGAGLGGLLAWRWAYRVRDRLKNRLEELRAEKQNTEAALDDVSDRIGTLEDVSGAKSHFLKELSHAFRTPLTLTLGPVENLLEGKHGSLSEEAQTQLRLVQRNGTELLWLTNQLLDLAEMETKSRSLSPSEGDIVEFVAKGLWSFEGLAERQDVRLQFETSVDSPTCWFDEETIEKILANLLTAVFRSVDEGGTIHVAVRPGRSDETTESSEWVRLVVQEGSNEASGERAESVLSAVRRKGQSPWDGQDARVGVGVYLAHKLADLHRGELTVEGSAGSGLRFVARLPRRPERCDSDEGYTGDALPESVQEQGADMLTLSRKALLRSADDEDLDAVHLTPESRGQEPPRTKDRTTVLVVDDNAVVRTLLRSHLQSKYRVVEAEEGITAYNLATSLLPDLVISDVMMPEMDGFELCRKIKQDPDVDHVPVILLTARADPEDKVEGLDLGADVYMTKPFVAEELVAQVDNLIETRRSLRQAFREERTTRTSARPTGNTDSSREDEDAAEDALPGGAREHSFTDRLEEAISNHLTDPEFEVSDLASETALSPSQLRRRMRDEYDCTPVQLIRRRRLEAGARLLREREEATIGEVAYAVGFNSQSYFSRSFRDEFGVSPSQYRSQYRSTEV